MPYKDKEKRRQINRESMQRTRGTQTKGTQEEGYTDPWEPILEKVRQHDQGKDVKFSPGELKTILQWGIDTDRIRARDDVATEYDLTQPEPRYGPQGLTKVEVCDKINAELKEKKIPTQVFFLGGTNPEASAGVLYSYSRDWYK